MERSFLPIAAEHPFSLANLPYGVFRPRAGGTLRCGVAIGEWVLDLAVLEAADLLREALAGRMLFAQPSLNAFIACGAATWQAVRARLTELLGAECPLLRDAPALRAAALLPQQAIAMELPVQIGDYSDFYASLDHASNVGTMFRGAANALQPNWRHLPVGYHGRASSIVRDGTPIRRPRGQRLPAGAQAPVFGPSERLDYELELGVIVGPGNPQGQPIAIGQAEEQIFGVVLVNDWSARDLQAWEYVPLGPFLAKSFATTISPWVVPLAALEPLRCPGPPHDPAPLPYLRGGTLSLFNLNLRAELCPQGESERFLLSETNACNLYWSFAQMIAHHTVAGCNLRSGDLIASGTISGPTRRERGCLLELTWNGSEPLALGPDLVRTWLEDGDELILSAWGETPSGRVGFGSAAGLILPALG